MPNRPQSARRLLSTASCTSAVLAARGLTPRVLARAVRDGTILRLRRNVYVPLGTSPQMVRAARQGGRLDCVSLLAELGVFVRGDGRLHIQVSVGKSRIPPAAPDVRRHWRRTTVESRCLATSLIEALAQACRCQSPRDAIATLDSAWHLRLVDEHDLGAVFALLPRRYRRLRPLLDRRSESGPETIMRLMLRGLGCSVEVQVRIAVVGRVDFVVDGWLIVECDSRAHHEGWEAQKRDRRRDITAASLGYTTIRPLAEDILYRREETLATLKTVLQSRGPRSDARNSSSGLPQRRVAP